MARWAMVRKDRRQSFPELDSGVDRGQTPLPRGPNCYSQPATIEIQVLYAADPMDA